jgi:D-alanyl-D-alanine carboxypeptidase/D-alanyl-D-alanine-endopeptidase (penicillin-binding protein 4)
MSRSSVWWRRPVFAAGVVLVAVVASGSSRPAVRGLAVSQDVATATPQPSASEPTPPLSSATITSVTVGKTLTAPSCPVDGEQSPLAIEPPPSALVATLHERLADRRFSGVALGASIWIEGYGEVVDAQADLPLLPASNQKLLTALGALLTLPRDGAFTTTVQASSPVVDGTLEGDLALVGGGDPTLTRVGPNSLDTLAAQVRALGITRVDGAVLADESRHEEARAAEGWQDWQIPTYAGPLSALMVDDNRARADAAYLADPATGNAQMFVDALRRHGVTVRRGVRSGVVDVGAEILATTSSQPFGALVAEMLDRSDNEIAEMLVREVARRAIGVGSTSVGAKVIEDAIERELCLQLDGHSGDGSGLSRADLRSARTLRLLLQAAQRSALWNAIDSALPVGASSGTLANRFAGTAAAGNVHAKTGSIIGGRALTGHLRTRGGREVVFSILVNGDASADAQRAIDALVVALANDGS